VAVHDGEELAADFVAHLAAETSSRVHLRLAGPATGLR
jgi:hypothetical protein